MESSYAFSSDNSSDFNDLEVAAVMAYVPKNDEADSASSCSSVPVVPSSLTISSINRSSTVMTNIPRGNSASEMPPLNNCWSLGHLSYQGDLQSLKQSVTDANIDSVDDAGRTPLMLAAVAGWIHVVQFLLQRGASVDVSDDQGATALHISCSLGRKAIALALIEHGADVDLLTEDGNTPLHYAVFGNHKDCVCLILSSGADLTIKNSDGLTSADLAYRLRRNELVDVFKDYLLSLFGE